VRPGIEIRHTRAGGTGVQSAVRTHLDEYPFRLEYGTPNTVGIAGLSAGLKWILAKGLDALQDHEMKLARQLRDGSRAIPGVLCPKAFKPARSTTLPCPLYCIRGQSRLV
jgi:selenocysteine lyase/cysteine desulfurase